MSTFDIPNFTHELRDNTIVIYSHNCSTLKLISENANLAAFEYFPQREMKMEEHISNVTKHNKPQ